MRLKRSPMRQRLKDRRACESFELEVAGQRYTATIGRYVDGTIGEIFLQSRKPGSQSDANARGKARKPMTQNMLARIRPEMTADKQESE